MKTTTQTSPATYLHTIDQTRRTLRAMDHASRETSAARAEIKRARAAQKALRTLRARRFDFQDY